jgi:hypothetical protein
MTFNDKTIFKISNSKKRTSKQIKNLNKIDEEIKAEEKSRTGYKKKTRPSVEKKCKKTKKTLDKSPTIAASESSDGNEYDIKAACTEMLSASDEQSYNTIKAKLDQIVKELKSLTVSDEDSPMNEPRFTLLQLDGSVMYDSSKNTLDANGDVDIDPDSGNPITQNTFSNYESRAIGDNHNTRKAVMESHMNDDGEGMEVKPSTTTGTSEAYVSQLIEADTDAENDEGETLPLGTVRLSEAEFDAS